MMRRRDFITLLGGAAAAWPIAARAQQPTMPVIGFLESRSADVLTDRLRAFRQGLRGTGYIEGENVAILYRWAENQKDRLPILAAELARRPVAVIVATGGPDVVFAAKAATTTTPVVFLIAQDPVAVGLVASLARPGGNLTGVNFLNRELADKQLELLHKLVPSISRVAVLVNPTSTTAAKQILQALDPAGRSLGLQLEVLNASTSREIDAAFASFAHARPDAVFVSQDPFFNSRCLQLSMQAMRHGLPASYSGREYAEVGGLMSYGSNITDAYREVGIHCGRILKGAKAADLPVVQSIKFEFVINMQTARILGLTVPQSLLATADEVIE
jgi:putative tryptophan/tyrosine transport system substrate-binding protein